jgi:DNA-binding NarL/FixJ family response regulator
MAATVPYEGEERRRSEPIRVVVADDFALFRHGVRETLVEYGLSVVGEASTGERAIQLVHETQPHVVVMDLNMPGIGGVEAIRRLSHDAPLTKIIVLTVSADDETVIDAIMAGACGYLLKDAPAEQIPAAVRAAYGGASLISPRIGFMLLDRLRAQEEERAALAPGPHLSKRELEVLLLVAEGNDNQEIAAKLFVSPSTVKNHISNVLAKLQMKNRIQAAVYAAKQGML